MRLLHILCDIFAVLGPLASGHIEMGSFAIGAIRQRDVALHGAVEADSSEAIVRINVIITGGRWSCR